MDQETIRKILDAVPIKGTVFDCDHGGHCVEWRSGDTYLSVDDDEGDLYGHNYNTSTKQIEELLVGLPQLDKLIEWLKSRPIEEVS